MQICLGCVGLCQNVCKRYVALISCIIHRLNNNKTFFFVCYLQRHRLYGGNKETAEIKRLITAAKRACNRSRGRKQKKTFNIIIRTWFLSHGFTPVVTPAPVVCAIFQGFLARLYIERELRLAVSWQRFLGQPSNHASNTSLRVQKIFFCVILSILKVFTNMKTSHVIFQP